MLQHPVGCDYCEGEPKDVLRRVIAYNQQIRGAMVSLLLFPSPSVFFSF
jgi:hypothetical protein